MIVTLLYLLNASACLLCAWVAGCYLLSLERPRRAIDLLTMLAALGCCVYGVGNAFAPLRWEAMPNLLSLAWRVCLAMAAAVLYSRLFGWRQLCRHVLSVPCGWAAWWRQHIDAGREAGNHRRPQ